jgi:hypothetical protein
MDLDRYCKKLNTQTSKFLALGVLIKIRKKQTKLAVPNNRVVLQSNKIQAFVNVFWTVKFAARKNFR